MASDKYLTVSIDVGYAQKRVFQSQGLTFPMSSIVGVLGRNGAGKTTLLKCITGLFPTTGITWHRPMRIAALIEASQFNDGWTALQQLEHQAHLYSCSTEQIEDILVKTGLTAIKNKAIGTYSLGQKQRLGIAKTLIARPDCLILDEPTNGLDPQGIAEVRSLIQDLHHDGINIILSSHLLVEVQACCTHLVVIDKQQVQFAGPISEFSSHGVLIKSKASHQLQQFLKERNWRHSKLEDGWLIEEDLAPSVINEQCFQANITLSYLSIYERSLEASFMERS